MHLTNARPLYERLTASDVDLRIKNSRVGLLSWTHAVNLEGTDGAHIVPICDTEIGLLEGLRGLSPDQQVAVDLLLHRWRDLRVQAGRGQPKPRTTYPRRRRGRSAA